MPTEKPTRKILKLLRGLYPPFIQCLRSCDLRGTEWFALSFIQEHGKRHENVCVFLISDMTGMLTTLLYDTRGGAAGFITKLCDRKFIRRGSVTSEEKKKLFGSSAGSTAVVVLLPEGERKLEDFNTEVLRTLERAGGPTSRLTFSLLTRLAPPLIKIAGLSLPPRSKTRA